MRECVVRMEMPKNCAKCDLHYRCSESRGIYGFDAIREMMRLDTVNDKREDEHCLFVCSLPEGHRRLVDAGNAFNKIVESSIDGYISNVGVYSCLQELTTIVPADTAERSET